MNDLIPGLWNVRRGDYHADRLCDCHSSLEVFKRSIVLYRAVFVDGSLAAPGPTGAQEFGTAFHTWLLEPEKFDQEIVVQPERWDLRTNKGKEAQAEFMAGSGGRAVISAAEFDTVQRMADSARSRRAARELLEAPGLVEQAIRWRDPDTGLALRAMMDKMVRGGPSVDVKTAIDPTPEGFAKAAANFGYHRQHALYVDGRIHALHESVPFLFLVVGKEPPYECAVYRLGESAESLGRGQNTRLLYELRDCKDFGRYESRMGDEVIDLALPRWAYYDR